MKLEIKEKKNCLQGFELKIHPKTRQQGCDRFTSTYETAHSRHGEGICNRKPSSEERKGWSKMCPINGQEEVHLGSCD